MTEMGHQLFCNGMCAEPEAMFNHVKVGVEGLQNSYSHVCRFYLVVLTNLASSMVAAGYRDDLDQGFA